MAAVRGTTYEPLFLTALNTGARIGELLALTWEDINLDTCEIRISKTLEYQKTSRQENMRTRLSHQRRMPATGPSPSPIS